MYKFKNSKVTDYPLIKPFGYQLAKCQKLLWFTEGKQSTEKPGVAVCDESRKHGFEWKCRGEILGSTPNSIILLGVSFYFAHAMADVSTCHTDLMQCFIIYLYFKKIESKFEYTL